MCLICKHEAAPASGIWKNLVETSTILVPVGKQSIRGIAKTLAPTGVCGHVHGCELTTLRILALNDGEAALAITAHVPNQFLFLVMFLPVMLRATGYFSGMDVRV